MTTRHTTPPTLAELHQIATAELARIPETLRRHVGSVVISVEDFPDEDTEDEMDLESPFDLLGLYRGVALPFQSVLDVRTSPDMI
ncbi:MAG TPA: metallopeptidase family protein, partial [Patescibacteria group bacterium]|nr:metallopeptidase family protein [Patescibacteria group bacterium]